MFTIRGENIYPSEIDAALNETPGYGGEHRIVITRESEMDEMLLKVEPDMSTNDAGADRVEAFRSEVARKMQKVLGVRTIVEVAAPGSIPRTDFKARRVIDDRAVFREMRAELDRAAQA
jgi:phenylacetate-CoA ligase